MLRERKMQLNYTGKSSDFFFPFTTYSQYQTLNVFKIPREKIFSIYNVIAHKAIN